MSNIERSHEEVVIEGEVVIFPNAGRYEIGLSRLDSPEKLLSWIVHLSEKTWFSPDICRWFILKVSRHHKMKVPASV